MATRKPLVATAAAHKSSSSDLDTENPGVSSVVPTGLASRPSVIKPAAFTSPRRTPDVSPTRQIPTLTRNSSDTDRTGPHTPSYTAHRPPRISLNEATQRILQGDVDKDQKWPTSPRSLKSPINSRRNSTVSRSDDVSDTDRSRKPNTAEPRSSTAQMSAAAKVSRAYSTLNSKLETVQEGEHAADKQQSDGQSTAASSVAVSPELRTQDPPKDDKLDVPKLLPKAATEPMPPVSTAKRPSVVAKMRPNNETSVSNMIVETETVPTIPTASVSTQADRLTAKNENGSIKNKPSSETIRPRKDRKKAQKRPSVVAGVGTTKADMFEAKIYSAEEDDSDSDETFVYESNPAEPRPKSQRYHSRTPSGTSLHSLADRRARGYFDRGVKSKRSMKFSSNAFAANSEDEPEYGTVRAHKRPSSMIGGHYQESAGWSGGDLTMTARDAPQRESRRGTPRHSPKTSGSPFNASPPANTNERQPLLGSLRAPRTRASRRPQSSHLRHMEYYGEPRRSWARRCSGCLVIFIFVCLVVACGGGALYATSKPLYGVSVLAVQNILASEEELMFDLNCAAVNPNIVSINVNDMDVNVFARSRHVGTDSYWRRHGADEPDGLLGRKRPPYIRSPIHVLKNVDEGTDPIDDPEGDPQTMLLGTILHFDSPLTFEASAFRRMASNSTGELRLAKPGNKTELGGSARWERVIQHPFDLIVRGVLRYELPLNGRVVTASISKSITVDPKIKVPIVKVPKDDD